MINKKQEKNGAGFASPLEVRSQKIDAIYEAQNVKLLLYPLGNNRFSIFIHSTVEGESEVKHIGFRGTPDQARALFTAIKLHTLFIPEVEVTELHQYSMDLLDHYHEAVEKYLRIRH
jgi:hypothetical protein